MILRDTVFPLFTSRTLNQAGLLALVFAAYSLIPLIKEYSIYRDVGDVPPEMHAALSLMLGALLVFRTNTAYSRWWEARTLWGSLVNASRNLAMKLVAFGNMTADEGQDIRDKLAEFPRLLMFHLRKPTPLADPEKPPITRHLPMALVHQLYGWIESKHRNGLIDGDELRVIDAELARFMDICGGCERIARTPLVRSYRIFARQCIILFLLTFPWGVAEAFQWWTIPLTLTMSYFMFGMEIVAEHVEDPFGLDDDDLDLDSLCDTIDKSVTEVFRLPSESLSVTN